MAAAAAQYYFRFRTWWCHSSESQHQSANQISSTYLNLLLRYNYFRFRQTSARRIGILLPVSILTISPYSACDTALGCRISCKSVHTQRRYNVVSIFKMAAAMTQYCFLFRIWWYHSLQKVNIYQQIEYQFTYLNPRLRYNYFRFEKSKRPPYWNSTSGFNFDHIAAVGMSLCTSLPNFVHMDRPRQKNYVMSIFKMADLRYLEFQVSNNGFVEKPT